MTLSGLAVSIPAMAAPCTVPRSYTHPQGTVDTDVTGAFIDCGRWRERGVSHWHLISEEWQLSDNRDRFDTARVRAASLRRDEAAFTPQQALDWLDKTARDTVARSSNPQYLLQRALLLTEHDWWLRAETMFHSLMHGHPAGAGLLIAPGRTADAMAYPMTDRDCAACTR